MAEPARHHLERLTLQLPSMTPAEAAAAGDGGGGAGQFAVLAERGLGGTGIIALIAGLRGVVDEMSWRDLQAC